MSDCTISGVAKTFRQAAVVKFEFAVTDLIAIAKTGAMAKPVAIVMMTVVAILCLFDRSGRWREIIGRVG